MTHESPPAQSPPTISRSRSQIVRGRLGRRLAWFLCAAFVLCAVVVWQRDLRHIEASCNAMAVYVAPLENHVRQEGRLPIAYPTDEIAQSSAQAAITYATPDIIHWASQTTRPVVIGNGPAQGLIVRPNGRSVIVYESGKLRVEWMSNARLAQLLEEQQQLASEQSGRDD